MTRAQLEGNPFALVSIVRLRANAIAFGAEPRVGVCAGENPVATAMREVEAGAVLGVADEDSRT